MTSPKENASRDFGKFLHAFHQKNVQEELKRFLRKLRLKTFAISHKHGAILIYLCDNHVKINTDSVNSRIPEEIWDNLTERINKKPFEG